MTKADTTYLKQATLAALGGFEAMARRRFGDEALAGEAVNFVLDALAADDWRRVREHRGQGLLQRYILSLARNSLEDFARARFGRVRVPDWVRVRGALWERIYRLLCLERQTSRATTELVIAEAPGGRDPDVVDEALRAIRARYPHCGAHGPEEVPLEDVSRAKSPDGHAPLASARTPEDDCLELEQELEREALMGALMQALRDRVPGEEADGAAPVGANLAGIGDGIGEASALPPLTLSAEERLLLRLVHLDGVKVTAAGRQLGLGAHQTHGRLRRLHQRLRDWCEACGFRLGPEDFR